jgi:hypothetical protein
MSQLERGLRRELLETQADLRRAQERLRDAEHRRELAEQAAREAWRTARWLAPGPARRTNS